MAPDHPPRATNVALELAARGRLSAVFRDPSGVSLGRQGLSTLANVRPDYVDTTDAHSQTTYSLRTLGNLLTLHQRKGYDDSTGLGSPMAPAFVRAVG